ncbi:hypothetical protein NP493_585g01017 [Ridgeia piscesae]|uniref:Uncharacterized protein n=1 Tax=Ridgeia piscesae TaxID=27915 RepID=A0AAD9NRA1_RIDPI|nr:hypothetical protein NP493_585g01017 [Ridgeia piscesae]
MQLMSDVDNQKKTPLHVAVENGCCKAAKLLIDKGATHTVPKTCHSTPLHLAAISGNIEILRLLTGNLNVCIDVKDCDDMTPLHHAAAHNQWATVEFLLKLVVDELIKNNGELVIHEDDGENTALHLAASNGHMSTAQALIDAKANVAARNRALWTPLDCAAAKGKVDVVKVLLDAGGPIENRDKNNNTPLLLASERGHVSVVNTLIERGANVAVKDRNGLNCLDVAIKQGHKYVTTIMTVKETHAKQIRKPNDLF